MALGTPNLINCNLFEQFQVVFLFCRLCEPRSDHLSDINCEWRLTPAYVFYGACQCMHDVHVGYS